MADIRCVVASTVQTRRLGVLSPHQCILDDSHPMVEEVYQVEIDERVVELS